MLITSLPRPSKIVLGSGVKVTRSEYEHIKSLELDVTLPAKAPSQPAAA